MLTTQKEIIPQHREDGSTEDCQCEEETETNSSFNKALQNSSTLFALPFMFCCFVFVSSCLFFLMSFSFLLSVIFFFCHCQSTQPNKFHMCEYSVWDIHYSAIFVHVQKRWLSVEMGVLSVEPKWKVFT